MTKQLKEHRRPNLATIVGSGLAAVAAGSLLAFSSLAEQAGLQGLATGGIEPAAPVRGGGSRAIRLPAPSPAAPGEPADPIEQIVRDAVAKAAPITVPEPRVTPGAPEPEPEPEPRVRPEKKDKKKPHRNRPEKPDPVVVAARETTGEDEAETSEGPPYGNAYGHDKKSKKAKPAKHPKHHSKKDKKSDEPSGEPMYARSRADEGDDSESKPPKLEKVKKEKKHQPPGHAKHDKDNGNGKGLGHSKHGNGNGNGHSKHGKGKGHSKHGG